MSVPSSPSPPMGTAVPAGRPREKSGTAGRLFCNSSRSGPVSSSVGAGRAIPQPGLTWMSYIHKS